MRVCDVSHTVKLIKSDRSENPCSVILLFIFRAGAVLAIFNDKSRKSVAIVRAVGALAPTLAASRLCEYFISVGLKVDRIFFHYPSESLGLPPAGKMTSSQQ